MSSASTPEASIENVCSFVTGHPIRVLENGTRAACFPHTDFIHPICPSSVEDMANALIHSGIPFAECDIIVSVADRIAGALTHVLARKTSKPYSLANWYPVGSPGDVEVMPSKGFIGQGVIYLNGLFPKAKVVVIDDTLNTGATSTNIIEAVEKLGAEVLYLGFVIECDQAGGRTHPRIASLIEEKKMVSLVVVDLEGDTTHVKSHCEVQKEVLTFPGVGVDKFRTLSEVRALPQSVIDEYYAIVEATFTNVDITVNPTLGYPYCFFQLTDFKPLMVPHIVEKMADLCIYYSRMEDCDVIVSEADRGGGPLAHAVSQRIGLKYILAVWSTVVENVNACHSDIGYSGGATLHVNGITPNTKIAFVDDMLSSGGTAEGVLRAVEAAGGIPTEGVFISEKLYPGICPRKGMKRLYEQWPKLFCRTVVQFLVVGDKTTAPKTRVIKEEGEGDNEKNMIRSDENITDFSLHERLPPIVVLKNLIDNIKNNSNNNTTTSTNMESSNQSKCCIVQ